VLKENCGASITIREFTLRGRVHFHAAIYCRGDVSTGYNWDYHDEVTKWSKGGGHGPKPRGSLNRTPLLAKLHAVLNEKGPLYGLGRMELVPVRSPDAIGFYLGGYLSKSLANKPPDAKGTRAVNYSHKCPQIIPARWSWANESAWLWRAKLRTWATRHGCATMAEVAALFGAKWAYHHREAILATPLSYYPTSEHAHRDGVKCPPDSVDIRITRSAVTDPPATAAPPRGCSPRTARAEQPPEVVKPASLNPRCYRLHSREELHNRLKLPCQNYQRPLRLTKNESRTS
jgi:hypothetical protein